MPEDEYLKIPPASIPQTLEVTPESSCSIVPERIEAVYNISWESPNNDNSK